MDECKETLSQIPFLRASQAFQDITNHLRTHDELRDTLGMCEALIENLQYVRKVIEPCYPPHYEVFEQFNDIYTKVILEKLSGYTGGETFTGGDLHKIVD